MKLMGGTYSSLLFAGFGHRCPLYINVLALYRILDHEVMQEHTEKFTRAKCAQLTWQLLEESRFFFSQRLMADDFENGGPYSYPMSEMGSLFDEVRRHKNLIVDTLPRQWVFEEANGHRGGVRNFHKPPPGGGGHRGGKLRHTPQNVSPPPGIDPYAVSRQWESPSPDHRHPLLSTFMQPHLEKYNMVHLGKLLKAGNKTIASLPSMKEHVNKKGTNNICFNFLLDKCFIKGCKFAHLQNPAVTEGFAKTIIDVPKPCMDEVWKHGLPEGQPPHK